MPSFRLFSVAALAGLGAVASVAGGPSGPAEPTGVAPVGGSLIVEPSPAPVVPTPARTPTPTPNPTAEPEPDGGRGAAVAAVSGAGLDVRAENARPGTSGWRIGADRGRAPGLAAYAGAVSVTAGTPVPLRVDGSGPVRVRALRIGWYAGAGARQVWSGTVRARPANAPAGQWPVRGFADTTGWPEGHYLLRLDQAAASRYVPLTVRSAGTGGRVVVVTSPLSWQADNTRPERAEASLDRPYLTAFGAGGFLAGDLGVVQTAERTGRRLAFLTDADLTTDPGLLAGAAAVVVGGDSRFWTPTARSALAQAVARGTNLAVLGAGAGSRVVLLAPDGRRLRVRPGTPVAPTGLRPSCRAEPNPAAAPAPAADWAIVDADWWGYRGTGVRSGDALPDLVAGRVDRLDPTVTDPHRAESRPADSRRADRNSPPAAGSGRRIASGRSTCATGWAGQDAIYTVTRSGAGVLAVGTSRWACALATPCVDRRGRDVTVPRRSRVFAGQVTRNVIAAFEHPRAGRRPDRG